MADPVPPPSGPPPSGPPTSGPPSGPPSGSPPGPASGPPTSGPTSGPSPSAARWRHSSWLHPARGAVGWPEGVLVALAAVAGLAYAWAIGRDPLEPYYAAAVRSMAGSWRNFFFGGFDPAGTVTLDKLPGAFWVQALSVRVFGYHTWAIVLPQVIEGVLTVAPPVPGRPPAGRTDGRPDRRRRARRQPGDGGPQPGQHLGLPDDPPARRRGRRRCRPPSSRGARVAWCWPGSGSDWPSRPR